MSTPASELAHHTVRHLLSVREAKDLRPEPRKDGGLTARRCDGKGGLICKLPRKTDWGKDGYRGLTCILHELDAEIRQLNSRTDSFEWRHVGGVPEPVREVGSSQQSLIQIHRPSIHDHLPSTWCQGSIRPYE